VSEFACGGECEAAGQTGLLKLPNKILLAGHSHLNALVGDRYVQSPTLRSLDDRPDVTILDGPWPRPDDYWRALAKNARDKATGLMWGGNEHNSIYFFNAAYEFDFSSRYVARLLGRAQIVTQRTVKQRFREHSLGELDSALKALSAARPRKLALLGTPPPKKDNERLRQMLAAEPVFFEWAKTLGAPIETIGITDPFVRLKLWHVLQDMFREAAAKYDGAFVATPAEAQDDEGFLKDEYWAPDVTHANPAYGNLMLAKVLTELQT